MINERAYHSSYFDIIKEPMDLSTMGAKLEAGMYKDRFAFEADFRLILSNAKTYNLPGSHVHNETLAIESFFEKRRLYLYILSRTRDD
jgi:transcription initiation factor TFIID subunit 2